MFCYDYVNQFWEELRWKQSCIFGKMGKHGTSAVMRITPGLCLSWCVELWLSCTWPNGFLCARCRRHNTPYHLARAAIGLSPCGKYREERKMDFDNFKECICRRDQRGWLCSVRQYVMQTWWGWFEGKPVYMGGVLEWCTALLQACFDRSVKEYGRRC